MKFQNPSMHAWFIKYDMHQNSDEWNHSQMNGQPESNLPNFEVGGMLISYHHHPHLHYPAGPHLHLL